MAHGHGASDERGDALSRDVRGNAHSHTALPTAVRGNAHAKGKPTVTHNPPRALVVEDLREACEELRARGYQCDRLTHNELMSTTGELYSGRLADGEYDLVWLSTPADWYVRTPGRRGGPHWRRLAAWLMKAARTRVPVALWGPPGHPWTVPAVQEAIRDAGLTTMRIRLCALGQKYNEQDTRPSGSYLQLATSMDIVEPKKYTCSCKCAMSEHTLDWYGRSPEQAAWRQRIRMKCIQIACDEIFRLPPPPITAANSKLSAQAMSSKSSSSTSPTPALPTTALQHDDDGEEEEAHPTEARIRQKEKLKKDKEAGIKPRKRKFKVEPGSDDCGDDISGLGKDVASCRGTCYGRTTAATTRTSTLQPLPRLLSTPARPTCIA